VATLAGIIRRIYLNSSGYVLSPYSASHFLLTDEEIAVHDNAVRAEVAANRLKWGQIAEYYLGKFTYSPPLTFRSYSYEPSDTNYYNYSGEVPPSFTLIESPRIDTGTTQDDSVWTMSAEAKSGKLYALSDASYDVSSMTYVDSAAPAFVNDLRPLTSQSSGASKTFNQGAPTFRAIAPQGEPSKNPVCQHFTFKAGDESSFQVDFNETATKNAMKMPDLVISWVSTFGEPRSVTIAWPYTYVVADSGECFIGGRVVHPPRDIPVYSGFNISMKRLEFATYRPAPYGWVEGTKVIFGEQFKLLKAVSENWADPDTEEAMEGAAFDIRKFINGVDRMPCLSTEAFAHTTKGIIYCPFLHIWYSAYLTNTFNPIAHLGTGASTSKRNYSLDNSISVATETIGNGVVKFRDNLGRIVDEINGYYLTYGGSSAPIEDNQLYVSELGALASGFGKSRSNMRRQAPQWVADWLPRHFVARLDWTFQFYQNYDSQSGRQSNFGARISPASKEWEENHDEYPYLSAFTISAGDDYYNTPQPYDNTQPWKFLNVSQLGHTRGASSRAIYCPQGFSCLMVPFYSNFTSVSTTIGTAEINQYGAVQFSFSGTDYVEGMLTMTNAEGVIRIPIKRIPDKAIAHYLKPNNGGYIYPVRLDGQIGGTYEPVTVEGRTFTCNIPQGFTTFISRTSRASRVNVAHSGNESSLVAQGAFRLGRSDANGQYKIPTGFHGDHFVTLVDEYYCVAIEIPITLE
jgi:hypothetical protein